MKSVSYLKKIADGFNWAASVETSYLNTIKGRMFYDSNPFRHISDISAICLPTSLWLRHQKKVTAIVHCCWLHNHKQKTGLIKSSDHMPLFGNNLPTWHSSPQRSVVTDTCGKVCFDTYCLFLLDLHLQAHRQVLVGEEANKNRGRGLHSATDKKTLPPIIIWGVTCFRWNFPAPLHL